MKLLEAVAQNEVKGGKKDFKGVSMLCMYVSMYANMLFSDFFDGAGAVLGVDKDFKEGSDVIFDAAAEHVNNLSIVLNFRTTSDLKVAETIQNVIDVTIFTSLKKLIIVTGYVYVLQLILN